MKSARNAPMLIYAPFDLFSLIARKSLSWTMADQHRLTRRFTFSCFSRVKACSGQWQISINLRAVLPFLASCA
jgi:hypothetical protein